MKLIVGLGNPEPTYAGTRHNLGYLAVRLLASELGLPRFRRGRYGLVTGGGRDGLTLLLPTTFMNASGLAVASHLRGWSPRPEDVVVIHDDLDLPVGRIRLRLGGSSGGHRGVASVIDETGLEGFVRIKIGIGRPPAGVDPVDYVLGRPTGPEEEALEAAARRAAEAALAVVRDGVEAAMNRFNRNAGAAGGDAAGGEAPDGGPAAAEDDAAVKG